MARFTFDLSNVTEMKWARDMLNAAISNMEHQEYLHKQEIDENSKRIMEHLNSTITASALDTGCCCCGGKGGDIAKKDKEHGG